MGDWTEILWGVVPAEKLDECFRTAYRSHVPNRIFEAAHVIQAWNSVRASGITETARAPICTLCIAHLEDSTVALCPFHQEKKRMITDTS